MKIALNATSLLSPLTGIGQYTYQLAKGLRATQGLDVDYFYGNSWSKNIVLPQNAGPKQTKDNVLKAAAKKMVPNTVRTQLHRYRFQRNFNIGCAATLPDLYHEPNFIAHHAKIPTVITAHDLSWIRFPHVHSKNLIFDMNLNFPKSLARASLIITDSEFGKRELMDVFGVPASNIEAISLGADAAFYPRTASQTKRVLENQKLLHGQYILAVGTLEPRKNLSVALQAFTQLPVKLRQRYPLVVVGMKGWLTSDLERQMAPLVATGEIKVLGYLQHEELAVVMSGATCLVYPSIYEGFGLPPLEAMSCAVPVICSNASSLPEVVGDSGELIDPHDVDAFAEYFKRIIEDVDYRELLAQKALARSTLFSWEKCVNQTVAVYQRAILMA